ncbi:hypothetical protein OG455_23870 [Kitasatospora sp. NBC_01287]|uniref:hypothetical protein n=1 Tax=Kitasatospora sp. NBC_01287 TaxID=2903573 RepID=UPI002259BAE0|nr:hypothetical protein [Kitasatospora sp. NBC_01287]MCX4748516.1 hypothetical protein [Kitasatospora sp. NBC_01287]
MAGSPPDTIAPVGVDPKLIFGWSAGPGCSPPLVVEAAGLLGAPLDAPLGEPLGELPAEPLGEPLGELLGDGATVPPGVPVGEMPAVDGLGDGDGDALSAKAAGPAMAASRTAPPDVAMARRIRMKSPRWFAT